MPQTSPSFDDIFAVMTAVAAGDRTARVHFRYALNLDDKATRFAIELNFLLDKLTAEIEELRATPRTSTTSSRPTSGRT